MRMLHLNLLIIILGITATNYAQNFPDTIWEFNSEWYKDGWDIEKKIEFQDYIIDSTNITGLVIVHEGKLIHTYGDIKGNSYIASCRKSVLAMLYGKYVNNGQIDLENTLEELDIDDVTKLLPIEKRATIKNLISARSGVFLSGSNLGDSREFAPDRGSVNPGEYWLYSNWDFNLAGHIFEKVTGTNIYDEVENQLAIPLNMQDWDRSLQQKSGDSSISLFPAYHMWFSTRDIARLGLLMLNKGKWNDVQIIDEDWVNKITSQVTTSEEVNNNAPSSNEIQVDFGYGYMWWLWENVPHSNLDGAYTAAGYLGQNITVLPQMDAVIAYKTNSIYGRGNSKDTQVSVIIKIARMYNADIGDVKRQLSDSFSRKEIKEAIADFNAIKKVCSSLNFEPFLNMLGYEFLGKGEYKTALAIFKLNVQEYPDSWNVYDSMAEGFEQSGDVQNAIDYYKKSIELNPENEHGISKLKKLTAND